ncbi:helix-turn-helix domain-containing protein [Sinosporangium siamense]|uniref:Resolvase HTH domain-containing protein n=1 Tax=Sinosporangium siamense TaxID=1367973 RepID=A0A919VAH1_9ACTN|nr:helix-turn-helix domain-containing protein [Sinosporangium siamense]GII96466.1 hypothetical protein Ssi02_66970 [Sinosporangium siamense]
MAGRRPKIDRVQLGRLVEAGWSVQELAERFGVSESGVLQAKRAAGLSKAMLDHSRAIPWRLRAEHRQSGPATNLRNLSAVAQGRKIPEEKLNTALRWARRLVDGGLDIAYRPEDGFCEITASEDSHIAALLADVRRVVEE